MTADEIRGFELYNHEPGNMNAWDSAFFLKEIAAQLTSANELKRIEMGIDPEPIPPTGRYVSDALHAEMQEIIDTARKVSESSHLLSNSTGIDRENLDRLAVLFDRYNQVPF
jgi:hypothetical protein